MSSLWDDDVGSKSSNVCEGCNNFWVENELNLASVCVAASMAERNCNIKKVVAFIKEGKFGEPKVSLSVEEKLNEVF